MACACFLKVNPTDLLHIIDLEGKKIKVTDLPAAIRQVKQFASYLPENQDPAHRKMCSRLHTYWKDALEKLTQLEQQENTKDHEQPSR